MVTDCYFVFYYIYIKKINCYFQCIQSKMIYKGTKIRKKEKVFLLLLLLCVMRMLFLIFDIVI
jgi:hypothetical protein